MADESDATPLTADAWARSAPDTAWPPSRRGFEIMQLLRRVTVASGRFTDSFAESHDLHRTDLNALSVLLDAGRRGRALNAGELASSLHLSAPATTALLDRLSRVGHVQRRRNTADRRIVDVEISPQAHVLGRQLFEPMGRHVGIVMSRYRDEELSLIERFLGEALQAIEDAAGEAAGARAHPGPAQARAEQGPAGALPPPHITRSPDPPHSR